jgi:hypothetical protein
LFSGKTMARELEDKAAAYDGVCELEITKNTKILKILGLAPLVNEMTTLHQTRPVGKQKKR